MTAIDFYKFISNNHIEYRWEFNNQERDVVIFLSFENIRQLHYILSPSDFDDNGITCYMKDGYFAIWASTILDKYGIELGEIFGKYE